ncbi:MAG: WXG100 family type VII secretion target, partial [Chloroflexi bacterium]|nr:WXG100 family type VII secretion target [Chloroflexota bacterium]
MTTIHLQTETGHQTASSLKQNSALAQEELQALKTLMQTLESVWQGNAQTEFASEGNSLLSQMQNHMGILQTLAERLEREVQEWEDVDNRGSSSMQGMNLQFLRNGPGGTLFNVPYAGGSGNVPFYSSAVLPLFTSLSILPFFTGLP